MIDVEQVRNYIVPLAGSCVEELQLYNQMVPMLIKDARLSPVEAESVLLLGEAIIHSSSLIVNLLNELNNL